MEETRREACKILGCQAISIGNLAKLYELTMAYSRDGPGTVSEANLLEQIDYYTVTTGGGSHLVMVGQLECLFLGFGDAEVDNLVDSYIESHGRSLKTDHLFAVANVARKGDELNVALRFATEVLSKELLPDCDFPLHLIEASLIRRGYKGERACVDLIKLVIDPLASQIGWVSYDNNYRIVTWLDCQLVDRVSMPTTLPTSIRSEAQEILKRFLTERKHLLSIFYSQAREFCSDRLHDEIVMAIGPSVVASADFRSIHNTDRVMVALHRYSTTIVGGLTDTKLLGVELPKCLAKLSFSYL